MTKRSWAASRSTWRSTFSLIGLHRVFLDAEQREIRNGLDRLNAGSGVDADHQDADDLKGVVAVARHADVRTSQIRDVDERAGGGVALLGIDGVDGDLRVAREQRDEAFHLGLGVAHEAGTDLVVRGLSRAAQRRAKHGKKRQKKCCEPHWSLLSAMATQ